MNKTKQIDINLKAMADHGVSFTEMQIKELTKQYKLAQKINKMIAKDKSIKSSPLYEQGVSIMARGEEQLKETIIQLKDKLKVAKEMRKSIVRMINSKKS